MKTRTILAIVTIAVVAMLASEAMAQSDKEFLSDAIKADNSEIALGELAARKGASADVRSLGKTLADDHGKAKRDAATLAPDLQVKPTEGVTDEARQEQQKLQGLSGADFDREFVRYVIADHQKSIAEFKEKAGEGDRAVPKLAGRTLPTLEQHLKLARSLAGH